MQGRCRRYSLVFSTSSIYPIFYIACADDDSGYVKHMSTTRVNNICLSINMQSLIDRVPVDVIINHIIPYTYHCQPKHLLLDIRSYYTDKNILESVFFIDYNPHVLLYDLLCFCNKDTIPIYSINGCYRVIIKRHVSQQHKTNSEVDNYIFFTMYKRMPNNVERKINFIWGLLLPKERTQFLNIYLENRYDY